MQPGAAVLNSLMWILSICGISFVFIFVVIAMIAHRRRKLNQEIAKIPLVKLHVTKNDLGKIYETADELWNRRTTTFPMPERRIHSKNYACTEDGSYLDIPREIEKSFLQISEAAVTRGRQYARPTSLTASDYLAWLSTQDGMNIPQGVLFDYITLYHKARYGPHRTVFDSLDLQTCHTLTEQIIQGINGR